MKGTNIHKQGYFLLQVLVIQSQTIQMKPVERLL